MGASGEPLLEFLEVMRRLRAECAWKAGQTHLSLTRYLLEETHETIEAIESGDAAHLREELGDLLLQVYFHAVIAEETGEFTIDDVAADIIEKMRRRNPHVFAPHDRQGEEGGTPAPTDAAQINEVWESIKAAEKRRTSVTEGLPPGLPALLYADKVLDRMERAGTPVAEVDDGATIGDRLLALVAEARAAGLDPEQELRQTARRVAAEPG